MGAQKHSWNYFNFWKGAKSYLFLTVVKISSMVLSYPCDQPFKSQFLCTIYQLLKYSNSTISLCVCVLSGCMLFLNIYVYAPRLSL